MKNSWVAFFSQTGAEIADIAERLGHWPDRIITNKRPDHLRTIDNRIPTELLRYTENKPEVHEYIWLLQEFDRPLITLHGWLRVMPAEICKQHRIYNGHPGLLTEYPELKGKDPQIRTFTGIQEGKYPVAGSVIHLVTVGVDEGPVKFETRFGTSGLTDIEELFSVLRDRSLYLWVNFLKEMF